MSKLEPLVAAPHSPDNRKTARECSDVKIDRVYIGSCTGKLGCLLFMCDVFVVVLVKSCVCSRRIGPVTDTHAYNCQLHCASSP